MGAEEPRHLRILVADERQELLEPISAAVIDLGHEVVCHEVDLTTVAAATVEYDPDVAIVVLHEDTAHALDLITLIVHESRCPVMVLIRDARPGFAAEAAHRGVFAYLDSSQPEELQGSIDVALERYDEFRRLQGAFDRRARIERAKGILMARHGIDEHEAFARLRGEARSSRRRLHEIVDGVIREQSG